MRALVLCLVAASIGGGVSPPVFGQDGKSSAALAEYEKIVAEYDASVAAYRAAAQKVQSTDEYRQARQARDTAKIQALMGDIELPQPEPLAQRALAAARQHAGQKGTAELLDWAVSNTRSDETRTAAIDELLEQHGDSAAILPFAENLPRMGRVLGIDGLAQIKERLAANPSKDVRANALYAWAQAVKGDKEATTEQKAAAEAATQQVLEMVPGSILAYRIEGPTFEKEHLQIGMPAPDIEGEDLDGVKFKLSDYRGKVVVVDFWGDW